MSKPEGSWASEMEEEFHGLPPPQPPTRLLVANTRINPLHQHHAYGGDYRHEHLNAPHVQVNHVHQQQPNHRHQQNYGPLSVNRHHQENLRYGSAHGGSQRQTYLANPGTNPAEQKKDKFPNYLHHVAPEDDPLATRTLFAGNLEMNICEEELRTIFGKFGQVDDVDIKRPAPGTGNAYAFVRFSNLDMAARAKSELSGQYIGKFQVKIGYGKANPTTKVWVGGLGSWATMDALKNEFSRYGMIRGIEWTPGETEAFISYEMLECAQIAVKELRGFHLGGQDHRIRTDFADSNEGAGHSMNQHYHPTQHGGTTMKKYSGAEDTVYYEMPQPLFLKPQTFRPNVDLYMKDAQACWTPEPPREFQAMRETYEQPRFISRPTTPKTVNLDQNTMFNLTGCFSMKNTSFPAEFWLLEGSFQIVEFLLKDSNNNVDLKITQRLKLNNTKVKDIDKRLINCESFSVFMAHPFQPSAQDNLEGGKNLSDLVAYLNGKDAAGVITPRTTHGNNDVILAFPPSPFSENFLKRFTALPRDGTTYILVIALVRENNYNSARNENSL